MTLGVRDVIRESGNLGSGILDPAREPPFFQSTCAYCFRIHSFGDEVVDPQVVSTTTRFQQRTAQSAWFDRLRQSCLPFRLHDCTLARVAVAGIRSLCLLR